MARTYAEWEQQIPETVRNDSLWRMEAYRLALFLADLVWHDADKLRSTRSRSLADQLLRAAGSIGANLAEGYSRGSSRDRARFYEYALGSARECRHWYLQARRDLGDLVLEHRLNLLTQIIRLLLRSIPQQRGDTLREEDATYHAVPAPDHPESTPPPNPPTPITSYEPGTDLTHDESRFTFHASRFTFHASPITLHTSEAAHDSLVTARRGDTVMVAGEGCWLMDAQGRRYLDLTAGQGVAMLGYGHPALAGAIGEQARRLHVCPNFFYNDVRAAFLQALMQVTPAHLTRAFLCNSGAEAIEAAIKFARLATGRPGLVAARNAFHGRTTGALSLTWNPKYRKPFEPLLPQVTHVPFNDVNALDTAIGPETAAVILEPVQGESGVNPATPEYLQAAQRLCRERGALLVLDEIQTGFGRTGRWFALEHYGVEPDILCLAKGIAGGFPMGAAVYTDRVQEALFTGAHGSTFGGNPLACAAGLAAITAYREEGLIDHADQMGAYLRDKLQKAIGDHILVREIRGMGLMIGIDLRRKVGPYLKALMEEHRVLALPAGSTVLRLLPPLIIQSEEIDLAVEAIQAVLS